IRLASSTSCSAVSRAVLPMVFRYTRTRSVDTSPLVSASRRGERTPRVSLGEDCNSVTVCLRPWLLFGCARRFLACGTSGCRGAGSRDHRGGSLFFLAGCVPPRQRPPPGPGFHESPDKREPTRSALRASRITPDRRTQRAG